MARLRQKAGGIAWRLAPSLAGLGVFIVFAAVRHFWFQLYQKLLAAFDTLPNVVPFGDIRAVLAAVACARRGVDVYMRNGCMGGGQYNYSTLLLKLAGVFPLGPGQGMAAGLFTAALVLSAVALLPPARSRGELALRIAAMGSSTLVDMLESANIDNLIFVAALCGVLALRHGAAGRVLGYGVFGLLAGIKFYPVALFTLLARESRRVFWAACGAGLVLGVLYMVRFGAGTITALTILPAGPPYNYMFGASNAATGIAVMFGHPASPLIPGATLVLVVLALAAAAREARGCAPALLALGETERLLLLAGAAVIAECFFIAQNYDYRGAFFLLALPGLCAMARVPGGERFRWCGLAVLFLMWEPLARYCAAELGRGLFGTGGVWLKMAFWVFRELMWWRVCVFFTALVFAHLGARLPALLPAPRPA